MKFKGEKELLADELYMNIEEELYELTKEETSKTSNFVEALVSDNCEEVNQIIEQVYNSNSLVYTYRSTAQAILQADFTLNELKVMHEYSKTKNCLRIIASVVEDNKENINIDNIGILSRFIKTLVMLKAKEIELQAI